MLTNTRLASCARLGAICAFLTLYGIGVANAGVILSGGGLTPVEEGPAAAVAGNPAPANLATGATAFTSSDLGPEIGIGFHLATSINDGAYGNSFSWIGDDTLKQPP